MSGLGVQAAPASDRTSRSTFETGEDLPGGAATSKSRTKNRNAFSHPSGNLTNEQEFNFRIGNGIFKKLWVSSPASTKSSDGLGPLYNARACQRCHLKDGRGHPPEGPSDNLVSMLFRLAVPPRTDDERSLLASGKTNSIPDPVYGGQMQDFAIQGHLAEAQIKIDYEEFEVRLAEGETAKLRRPNYRFEELGYGSMANDVMISPRIANQMIGLGLLDAISPGDILASADPNDMNDDGISGRPNMVWDVARETLSIGRFGWKAGQPTVRQQSAGAFSGDIGLSTTLFPASAGDCSSNQSACLAAPDGADPKKGNVEVSDELLDLVTFYARNLAVPRRPDAKEPQVLAGKELFHAAGCAQCHRPSYVTSSSKDVPAEHRGQKIWPYTDLLVHDMGEGLADGLTEGVANGREWRTPPLWGIGSTKAVNGHTFFLHDGRARNLNEAILWHGGEAETARENFVAMPKQDRDALIEFLNSL